MIVLQSVLFLLFCTSPYAAGVRALSPGRCDLNRPHAVGHWDSRSEAANQLVIKWRASPGLAWGTHQILNCRTGREMSRLAPHCTGCWPEGGGEDGEDGRVRPPRGWNWGEMNSAFLESQVRGDLGFSPRSPFGGESPRWWEFVPAVLGSQPCELSPGGP